MSECECIPCDACDRDIAEAPCTCMDDAYTCRWHLRTELDQTRARLEQAEAHIKATTMPGSITMPIERWEAIRKSERDLFARVTSLQTELNHEMGKHDMTRDALATADARVATIRAETLEEAANCVEAPPVGSIRHDIGKPFTLFGFSPRSLQEDLAKAVRALASKGDGK